MGLTGEYRDTVESIGDSMDSRLSRQDALSIKSSLDDVLPFILLLLVFVILFNFVMELSTRMQIWITWANYVVIAYFSIRLLVEFRLSSSRNKFFHEHVLDFLMIIPAISILQELKVLKFVEEFEMASLTPEFITGSAISQTGVAARLTKIAKIIKRSIGL